MADLIDFLVDVSKDKQKGRVFFDELTGKKTADELVQWFIGQGYPGISLEECDKVIKNKDDFLHKGDVLVNSKSNY